jgi:signal transduction histidine kinase
MPYNTKLYIKRKRPPIFAAGLCVLLAIIIFFVVAQDKSNPIEKIDAHAGELRMAALLAKAENYSASSTDSIEFYTRKLSELSIRENAPFYTVRARLIQGDLKKLKGDQASAYLFYAQAAALAKKEKLIALECEAILNLGEIHYKKGEYDLSQIWFQRADSIASQNKLSSLESYALYFLGKYNQTKGNFVKAKFYYFKSLAIARQKKDQKQLALLLPSLGKNFISEGKLDEALKCYQEAFHINAHLNDKLSAADICNHLGGLYLELKEFDKAMLYQRKALQYRLSGNYPGELAKSYNNIGKIYLSLNNLDSAEYYFMQSQRLCKKADYKKGMVKALANLGQVYRKQGNVRKASVYLHESFQLANAMGYDNGIATAGLDIGELYMDRKMLDSAIAYYNIALNKFKKTNYYEDLLKVYKGLYGAYLDKSDYKTALSYHTSVLATEKELLNVENKRQLSIINISFDTERKAQDYKVLLKEHELQASQIKSKNTLIWLFITVLGFTILFCFYIYNRFYIKKKANKKLEELNHTITKQNIQLKDLNKNIERVSKEKDKLFAIISHELRNPLYWLQNLAEVLSRKHNTMSAAKISKTLISMDESAKNVYHLMDNLLHWSRSKLNRVHPKKLRHNLFSLITETTRMYDTFLEQKEISLEVKIPSNVFILADSDLFACVVRNLLSNAIKYTSSGGKIGIHHQMNLSSVTIIIGDSGKGMNETEMKLLFTTKNSISMPGLLQEKGSGLGLQLCKDFVELNNGKIWAESISGLGTCFYFTVPLHSIDQLHEYEREFSEPFVKRD